MGDSAPSPAVVDRPAFHFTPPAGWLNDPLAVTHDGVRYHMFYQRVPNSLDWQPGCHWGHATSIDLIHWNAGLPDALVPDERDDGCWSGSLVVTDGGPQIFYSSVRKEDFSISQVCRAAARDEGWLDWAKQGPVDLELEPGTRVFRDPFVFRRGDWRMLVGGSDANESAVIYEYASPDLHNWTFEGRRLSLPRDPNATPWTGSACECPSLLDADGEDVLIFSVWDRDHLSHVVGCLPDRDGSAPSGRLQQLSFGDSYYAATVFRDELGRSCVLFWLRGFSGEDNGPWTGALSVCQRIEVVDGRIRLSPHPNLSRLLESGMTTRVESTGVHELPTRCRISVHQNAANAENGIQLIADEVVCVSIRTTSTGAVLATGEGTWVVPAEQVHEEWVFLRDGAILEVFLGGAVFACRLPLAGAGISIQLARGHIQPLDPSRVSADLETT